MQQKVGSGRLAIGHRPRFKDFQTLAKSGVNVLVTVLGEREGATDIGQRAQAAGINWLWLNLESAQIKLIEARSQPLTKFVQESLNPLFQDSKPNFVYLHCSASLHRTGMVTYAMLRGLRLSEREAREKLCELRPLAASEVGEDRLRAIDEHVVSNFKTR